METLRHCRIGDTRWAVARDWLGVLLDEHGLKLDQWLREGAAEVVKHGVHRTVYRVAAGGRSFYLKHYRCRGGADFLRHLVRASPARREWRKTLAVKSRGLATARPVAWGEQLRGGIVRDSFFVTETVAETRPLNEFLDRVLPELPRVRRERLRRRLTRKLAELCAHAHRAGVLHRDLHFGNLLVRLTETDDDDDVELFVIDLPSIRLSGPLTWSASRENLALLYRGMMQYSTRNIRWRFWREYLARRDDLRLANHVEAAETVARRGARLWRELARSREKRILATNRDFHPARAPGRKAHAVRDFPAEELAALLKDPTAPLRRFRHRPAKISHWSLVVQAELPLDSGVVRVAYKRTRVKRWWKAPFARLRPSRAMRGWRLGHALLLRGIPTARPIFVCQANHGREGYLATAWIEGAVDLHEYAWRLADWPTPQRQRQANCCACGLGELIGRLHFWQYAHRDLKAGNLAVVEDGPAGEHGASVFLIDLDGVTPDRRLSHTARAQNLARLAVSMRLHPWVTRTTRLRFLHAYLAAAGEPTSGWKRLWINAAEHSQAIERRMNRHVRPLG